MVGPIPALINHSVLPLALSANLWLDYARTLLALAAVCLAAVFTTRVLLPKLMGLSGSSASSLIQVLARQPLEPKKTLYLVRAGRSVILMAASGDGMQHMATLDGADFPEVALFPEKGKPPLFGQIARMAEARHQGRIEE